MRNPMNSWDKSDSFHNCKDHDVCIGCLKCVNTCPMDVDMLDDSRKRKNGTECILCCQCIEVCPQHALDIKK